MKLISSGLNVRLVLNIVLRMLNVCVCWVLLYSWVSVVLLLVKIIVVVRFCSVFNMFDRKRLCVR